MATGDNQERIIQEVLLSIQASIKGQKETVNQLKSINKSLAKADKSLQSYTKSAKKASKINTTFKKTLFGVGKVLRKLSSALGFFVGIAAQTFKKIMDVGKSFANLDTVITRGKGNLDSFTIAYKAMANEVGNSVVSLRDAADALGQFGGQSLAHMAVVAGPKFQKSFIKLQQTARDALGPIGDDLVKAMTNVPTDRLSLVADTIENLTPGTRAFTLAMYEASQAAGLAAGKLENAMDNADIDPVLAAWKTWQNIQNKLSAAFENFTVQLAQTFGKDISEAIEYLSTEVLEGMLIPALKTAINWIKDNKETVINVFKTISSTLTIIIEKIIAAAKETGKWFHRAVNLAKVFSLFTGFGGIATAASGAIGLFAGDKEVAPPSGAAGKKPGEKDLQNNIEKAATPTKKLELLFEGALSHIQLMASGMQSVVSQTESLNQQMQIFGIKGFGKNVSESAARSIDLGYKQLERATDLLKLANLMPENTTMQRAAKEEKINTALKAQAAAAKAISDGHKKILATTSTRLEQEEAITDLHKADLDISRSLYGTPALSITAHMNVVRSLSKQKKTIEEQLKIVQNRIKIEGKTRDLALQEIRLRTKAKRITAEQLQQVKELRDGYLDAVQAQAFGAGKFEKILITQEQNVGSALDANIVKRNYLLGQSGKQASLSNIKAFRASASGIGAYEGMKGNVLTPEDIAKRAAEGFKNIADPTMKQYVEEAQGLIIGIHGDASKWQKESQEATKGLITGLDNLTKTIIEERGKGAGGLQGNAANVAIGGALRGKGKGKVAGQVKSGVGGAARDIVNKIIPPLLELAAMVDSNDSQSNSYPGRGRVNNGGGGGN